MTSRHSLAAVLLALGLIQHAFAQEPAKPQSQDTQQEAQQNAPQAAAAQERASTNQNRHQEKTAPQPEATPPVLTTQQSAAAEGPAEPAKPQAVAATAANPAAEPASTSHPFIDEIKLTDVLLAFFTGMLVLLGWIQARRMREAVGAAKESVSVAEKSARVAEEALVSGQRAFMFIREIKTYLHQDPDTGKYHWTIHPVWANSGNTPTRNLSINTTYRLLDKPLPTGYDFPESRENLIPTIAGPRSMVEALPGTLSSEDLEAVKEGKKFFYIWGWAEYHDIFEGTKKRVTRFCNQLIQVDGNPLAPVEESNPMQMMFGFHAENNYAD